MSPARSKAGQHKDEAYSAPGVPPSSWKLKRYPSRRPFPHRGEQQIARVCEERVIQRKLKLAQKGSRIRIGGSGIGQRGLVFLHRVAFAGREKQVLLEAVLLGVELVVAAAELEQRLMRAALDDAAAFDHQDLIGAADGREPVGDDERRAALHQVREALLDQRFGFGVEAGRRLVENEDARDSPGSRGRSRRAGAGRRRASRRARRRWCRTSVRTSRQTRRRARCGRRAGSPPRVASGLEKATFSRIVPSNRNESCSTTPSCVR